MKVSMSMLTLHAENPLMTSMEAPPATRGKKERRNNSEDLNGMASALLTHDEVQHFTKKKTFTQVRLKELVGCQCIITVPVLEVNGECLSGSFKEHFLLLSGTV